MFWGVNYILHTYHNFGRVPTAEKFNPPANFSQFKHCMLSHDFAVGNRGIAYCVERLSGACKFVVKHV